MVDVLIAGSGASAVSAAWPLAEAGLRVLMLDTGERDTVYTPDVPPEDFLSLRRTDPEQHRYFLGGEFEGIPFGSVRVGAQLTPPRQHLARGSDALYPKNIEDGFQALEATSLGGLAAAWGASSTPFTDEEMDGWPIGRRELQPHYDAVTARTGICGTSGDDLAGIFGDSPGLLPPAHQDRNAREVHRLYMHRRARLHALGFLAGHPRLAFATRRFRGRGPARYLDMEFWADKDEAVWRPVYTLRELERFPNFEYREATRVLSFEESTDGVAVHAEDIREKRASTVQARHLVLAAGALGSARIAAESLRGWDTPLPLVSNPYTYYPVIVWRRAGRAVERRRHSLTQLLAYFRAPGDDEWIQAQFYSYRSLLMFKLMKESPLPHREARELLRYWMGSFMIVGVHHPDRPHEGKSVRLGPDGRLTISYRPTAGEERLRRRREQDLVRAVRLLGCIPVKRIDPGHGSSIHYAGTLPMARKPGPWQIGTAGCLYGCRHVTVADGSGFPHLPAKGLTFTLMANASRIGTLLAGRLRG